MWQDIVTYVIVAGAALFLIRNIVQSFRGEAGSCGGNCGCEASPKRGERPGARRELVQLGVDRVKQDA